MADQGNQANKRGSEQATKVTAESVIVYSIVVLIAALGALSQTAANPMLPVLAGEFGVGLDAIQWVTTGYILVIGVMVPIATFLSRKVCTRTHFAIGSLLFIAGSAFDAFAANFGMLLFGRVLQATAVGVLMPLMQVIAVVKFPENKRGTAMGVGGIALGFAPNVGPTFGAAMESAFGWRSFFMLLLVLNVVLLALTLVLIRKEPAKSPAARFDVVSFLYSTMGFGALLIGVSVVSSATNLLLQVALPVAVGVFFIVLFVLRQKKIEQPLMHLQIFETPQFNRGLVVMILHFSAFMGITMIIPLWVQNLCGGSSLDSGMVLLPATVVALIMNPVAGIFMDRVGIRPVMLVLSAFILTGALLEVTATEATPLWAMALYQAIRQFGIAGMIGPLQAWTLGRLEGPLISDGSSACIQFRQVGSSIGAAVMVLLIQVVAAAGFSTAVSYLAAFGFSAALGVAEVVLIVKYIK